MPVHRIDMGLIGKKDDAPASSKRPRPAAEREAPAVVIQTPSVISPQAVMGPPPIHAPAPSHAASIPEPAEEIRRLQQRISRLTEQLGRTASRAPLHSRRSEDMTGEAADAPATPQHISRRASSFAAQEVGTVEVAEVPAATAPWVSPPKLPRLVVRLPITPPDKPVCSPTLQHILHLLIIDTASVTPIS